MTMETYLPVLAILIPILVEGRYIYSIIKGETYPSFVSYLIFSVEMSVVFFSSYALGARDSLWIIGTFTILHIITAIFAFRFGYVSFSRFNLLCLFSSFLGIALWILTNNPWYALGVQIAVDSLGYLVLARKLYLCPQTEDRITWGGSILAYCFNIVLISNWVPEEYLFSVMNVLWCGVIFMLSLRVGRRTIAHKEQ